MWIICRLFLKPFPYFLRTECASLPASPRILLGQAPVYISSYSWKPIIFIRPGRSQGLLYKHLRDYSVSHSVMACGNVLLAEDSAFSHKIDHVTIFKDILNLLRASKSHNWFTTNGDFAEWVDFAAGLLKEKYSFAPSKFI